MLDRQKELPAHNRVVTFDLALRTLLYGAAPHRRQTECGA
jgi:hypothetical protein